MFNLIVQHLEKHSSTLQPLAYRGWHGADWRRWETAEPKGPQQQEMEGQLQSHACLC